MVMVNDAHRIKFCPSDILDRRFRLLLLMPGRARGLEDETWISLYPTSGLPTVLAPMSCMETWSLRGVASDACNPSRECTCFGGESFSGGWMYCSIPEAKPVPGCMLMGISSAADGRRGSKGSEGTPGAKDVRIEAYRSILATTSAKIPLTSRG